jgi:hypothetical protein
MAQRWRTPAMGLTFAGKRKRPAARALRAQLERGRMQAVAGALRVEELLHEALELIRIGLAARLAQDVPVRRDDDERGPGTDCIALPQLTVRIVGDGMRDPVAQHRLAHVLQITLGRELRTVHADHDELAWECVFETTQCLERMEAIDAAERPEVEDDQTPAQLRELQRSIDVQPRDAGHVEVRRADRHGAAHACGCLSSP